MAEAVGGGGKVGDGEMLTEGVGILTGSLKEDLVFHRRSARYLRDFGSR